MERRTKEHIKLWLGYSLFLLIVSFLASSYIYFTQENTFFECIIGSIAVFFVGLFFGFPGLILGSMSINEVYGDRE